MLFLYIKFNNRSHITDLRNIMNQVSEDRIEFYFCTKIETIVELDDEICDWFASQFDFVLGTDQL